MVERGRGKIIFTASLLSFQGGVLVPSYAAAKSGDRRPGQGARQRMGAARRQRQRDRARLHRDRQHAGAARRRRAQPRDPRPDPRRPLGRAERPRRRHGLPRLARIRLCLRHRPPGRRRMARRGEPERVLTHVCGRGVVPVVIRRRTRPGARRSRERSSAPDCRSSSSRPDERRPPSRVLRRLAADEDLLVGAGTVIRASRSTSRVEAGARFVVTPGLSGDVMRRCRELAMPVIPGVSTATEIIAALDHGCS